MRSNNNHKAITHLAMPERRIPVLIDSTPEKAEGFVPSVAWCVEKPFTKVRRLQPEFVENLKNPQKRKEIEKEHGAIRTEEWNRLRELLTLIDRVNAGDLSPVVTTNVEGALRELPALLDRLSPGGWFMDRDEPKTGKLSLRSASNDGRLTIDLGKLSLTPLEKAPQASKPTSHLKSATTHNSRPDVFSVDVTGTVKTFTFALSEGFTAGLSKTRFVVWWSNTAKKLLPGLYCPDIVTALYALAMWQNGTVGGWGVCQRCGCDYPRSRAKQRYCSHKCQVAAAMKRYRANLEQKAELESMAPLKRKKSTERK